MNSCSERMTSIITRAHVVKCTRCRHLTKVRSCCNTVSYLILPPQKCKYAAKVRNKGVNNEKEVKLSSDKQGFYQEADKQRMHKGRRSDAHSSVDKEDLRKRLAISVYERITRAKSKKNACVDVTCKEVKNTRNEKSNERPSKRHRVQTGEELCQIDVEVGQLKQDTMIEARMTRAKSNVLLQIQANKENTGVGCLHDCPSGESFLAEADSGNESFLTNNHMVQRKTKRMSATMYSEGLEESYCMSEKGEGSEPHKKSKGKDTSEKESRCQVMTRSAMHKQNATTMIKDETICSYKKSNSDLQDENKEVELTNQEQLEVTVSPQSNFFLKSCKIKDTKENMSNDNVLAKPAEISMQKAENLLSLKDSHYWSRNLRKKKSIAEKEMLNPVQVSHTPLHTKIRERSECSSETSTQFKTTAMASIPMRVTRSMQKSSPTMVDLEEMQIDEQCMVTHKRKQKQRGHSMPTRNIVKTEKCTSSSIPSRIKETHIKGKSHREGERLNMNSDEEAILNSSRKLDGKYQRKNCLNDVSGGKLEMGSKGCFDGNSGNSPAAITDEDDFFHGCDESELPEPNQVIEESEGNGHLHRLSKRKKKQNADLPRKEYLTRSKQVEMNIGEDKATDLLLKLEGSSTACISNELNSSNKRSGDAAKEVMPQDIPTLVAKQKILQNINSVCPLIESPKQKKSSPLKSQCLDTERGEDFGLKREGKTRSSTRSTPILKQTKKDSVGIQPSLTSDDKIHNGIIAETQECLPEVSCKGFQKQALCNAVVGIPPVIQSVISNSHPMGVKFGVLEGSNHKSSEINSNNLHIKSSECCDRNSYQELERQYGEIKLVFSNNSPQVEKSQKKGSDKPDSVQRADCSIADDKKKCFRVPTNPKDMGGRQMRPRPLDPLQQLPIVIEGRDQDFQDYDGLSFQCFPRLKEEGKSSNFPVDSVTDSMHGHTSLSHNLRRQNIKLPSYRLVIGYDEGRRSLSGGQSVYSIPGAYIRHTEMADKNQKNGLEYDIEDDDQEWLEEFNKRITEREIKSQLSEDTFEMLMEYFENESARVSAEKHIVVPMKDPLKDSKERRCSNFDLKIGKALTSDTRKQKLGLAWEKNSSMPSSVPQTSDCCICNGGENSVSNPVYKCESCAIYVHQSCYGIDEQLDAGQADSFQTSHWLCRKCEAFGRANEHICCAICCKNGGALKPTTNPAKWAHVVCALYTNEAFFLNTDSMEPIDGVSAVEVRSRRQKRLCCFCGARVGSCERCSVYGCRGTFHISCGVSRGAYFELQHINDQVVNVRSFCPRHGNLSLMRTALEEEACVDGKELKYKVGKAEKNSYGSDLQGLPTILQSDKILSSGWGHSDNGDLQYANSQINGTDCGFLEKELNINDASNIGNKGSLPKRRRRRNLRHRFQSAVRQRLSRCKTLSRNKMFVLDNGSNKGLNSQKNGNEKILYLTDINRRRKGRQLLKYMRSRGVNIGLVGGTVSDNSDVTVDESNQLIKLEEVLKANIGPASVVGEVYSYWLSKRAKKKGPLLQKFQQEQAAKSHGIFNQDSTGIGSSFGSKEDESGLLAGSHTADFELRQKLTGLQREMESVRSIARLVIRRERIKAQLLSDFQEVAELKLFSLQKKLGLMSCFLCKSHEKLLHCKQCKKIFCFHCYKQWNNHGLKSYRIVSCKECVCKDCEVVSTRGHRNSVVKNNISVKLETEVERTICEDSHRREN